MTQLVDFLRADFGDATRPGVEANPIVQNHALQEAVLVDVRFDMLHSSAALLFKLGGSLQFRRAAVGVLVLRGLGKLDFEFDYVNPNWTVWTVMSSKVERAGGKWTFIWAHSRTGGFAHLPR